MTSPIAYPLDDRDLLDDAALWAVIDSAAASAKSLKRINPYTTPSPPITISKNQHQKYTPPLSANRFRSLIDGEVVQHNHHHHHQYLSSRPSKIAKSQIESPRSPMPIVRRTPPLPDTTPSPLSSHHMSSADSNRSPSTLLCYSGGGAVQQIDNNNNDNAMTHSLSGRFPSVSLFKEYQNAALSILEKSDYMLISGSPYIKKTGWRKISCYFNISYEIKDKTIEFDGDRNVQRAEFVVRAHMQFSDGWGSCDRREKRFVKPNNDIPSTAETRAKNKACQDLLGIGGPGASRAKY